MSEPRFPPLEPSHLTPEQSRVAAELTRGPRGSVRGPYVPLIYSPELADRMRHLGDFIRFEGVLPPRLKEIVIFTVARHWSVEFMFAIHRDSAAQLGLSQAQIDAMARGERPSGLLAQEQAALDMAHELLRGARVGDAAYQAASAHFDRRGLIELVAFVGYYTTLAMILNTARIPLPAGRCAAAAAGALEASGRRRMDPHLRLTVAAADLAPARAALLAMAGRPRPARSRVTATYYDTEDHALHRRALTLEVRRSGRRYLQTVTHDTGADPAPEQWLDLIGGPRPDLAVSQARHRIDDELAGSALRPLFTTQIEKSSFRLRARLQAAATSRSRSSAARSAAAGGASDTLHVIDLVLRGGESVVLWDVALRLLELVPCRIEPQSAADRGFRLLAPDAEASAAATTASRSRAQGGHDVLDAAAATDRPQPDRGACALRQEARPRSTARPKRSTRCASRCGACARSWRRCARCCRKTITPGPTACCAGSGARWGTCGTSTCSMPAC